MGSKLVYMNCPSLDKGFGTRGPRVLEYLEYHLLHCLERVRVLYSTRVRDVQAALPQKDTLADSTRSQGKGIAPTYCTNTYRTCMYRLNRERKSKEQKIGR